MKNNYYIILNDKSVSAKHYIKKIAFKRYSLSVEYTLSESEALIIDYPKAIGLIVVLESEISSEYILEEAL